MSNDRAAANRNTYLPAGMPAPAASRDALDCEFYEAARRHELVVQRCGKCGTFQFPAEWICHKCHAFDPGWHRVSGRARIYSWERVWHPAHPALKNACPYLVVVVELEDAGGVRMVGNLLGDPLQEVRIDAAVEAVFEDHPEGHALIQWRLAAR
jgi:uncharacterized OB-fold protein